MTGDEMSDIIGGYKTDDSSTEVEDKLTVLVCGEIK